MKPARLDLPTVWRGCNYGPITFTWLDQNGVAIDLTGYTPRAQSLNIDFAPSVTDPANGVTQISLSNSVTAQFKLGVESWDWIWETTDSTTKLPPFLAGKVTIKEPTTIP